MQSADNGIPPLESSARDSSVSFEPIPSQYQHLVPNDLTPNGFLDDFTVDHSPFTSADPNPIHDPITNDQLTSPSPGPTSPPSTSHRGNRNAEQRRANTLAARRYRRNRVEKIAHLESSLKAMELERDELRKQVAHLQGENRGLRSAMQGRSS